MAVSLVVVGSGPWAQRHMATIEKAPNLRLGGVVSESLVGEMRKLAHGIKVSSVWPSTKSMIDEDYRPDGVVVAVQPPRMLASILPVLDVGIPLFVEKPLGLSTKEARLMSEHAIRGNVPLMVNFIHLFSIGYRRLRQELSSIGELRRVVAQGGNQGPDRAYMSALWDYGPHDLAFALDLLGRDPESINARVICGDRKNHVVSVEMGFSDGRSANLEFGNQLLEKVRRLICYGTDQYLQLDDYPSPALSVSGEHLPLDVVMTPLEVALQEFASVTAGAEDSRGTSSLAVRVNECIEEIERSLW
tara:strand:- start:1770 stop:2678 length:909 start_codon:yes stop_codon:yes gene_type:complete